MYTLRYKSLSLIDSKDSRNWWNYNISIKLELCKVMKVVDLEKWNSQNIYLTIAKFDNVLSSKYT